MTSAEKESAKEVFLKSLDIEESEYYRLLQWSVLPADGFSVVEVKWLEECLGLQADVPPEAFLHSCLQRGVVEPVDVDDDRVTPQRFQIEIPWHRLVEERSKIVLESAIECYVATTIEKLRQISKDFLSKTYYLESCREYERLSRLIFHVLTLILFPNSTHKIDDDFRRQLFLKSFFGKVIDSSIIGAFWYLQDRMEEDDRELFLAIRDAMLEKADWAEHPLLFGLIIKMEKVMRIVKSSKKYGDTDERKPLIENMDNDFKKALSTYNMEEDYPCIMGLYFDVALDILEKAAIVDGVRRDQAWKAELRILCSKSIDYWKKARLRLEGSDEQCHVLIHHIHAVSKEAHLQMLSGEVLESDLKHELVLKEAELRFGDHKITATLASFYGDFYEKRLERRANVTNKEDDYRRAMQFFMKEYRILQHCDKRDQSRVKINLAKQAYIKGLMGHGIEALVDAKKAYLMGEEVKDWKSEGSGYLRFNYLNVIFLHWMTREDRQSMGTKWWMMKELKSLLLPSHNLSMLRQTGLVLAPKSSPSEKPTFQEELVHNLTLAIYRVQARPRLLSPRIHPAHHLFWSNVMEEYVKTEDDQLIALDAVKIYMETGGVIVLRRGFPTSGCEKENNAGRSTTMPDTFPKLTAALKSIDMNDNNTNNNISAFPVVVNVEPVRGKSTETCVVETDASKAADAEETAKLLEAIQLLREAGIVNATVVGKWKALKRIKDY